MLGDVEPHASKKFIPARSSPFHPDRRSPALARSCRDSGTTGPFTRLKKRFSLLLSSSGGGLFDGRPKTQTWVWGAFVLPPGGSLRSRGPILLPSEAVQESIVTPHLSVPQDRQASERQSPGTVPSNVQIPKHVQLRRKQQVSRHPRRA